MSVTSLALDSCWRDFAGMWNAQVEPFIAPLERSKCHAPRIALIPALGQEVFSSSGKLTYNFRLVPGSIIWGLYPMSQSNAIQITDVGIGHKLFQEPVRSSIETTGPGVIQGRYPSPVLLPAPWPVVLEGLFTLEAWGNPGTRFYMLLGVAEVTTCPVR